MTTKARELQSDPRKARAMPKHRSGRVRLDTLLEEQKRVFNAARAEGRRIRAYITTED